MSTSFKDKYQRHKSPYNKSSAETSSNNAPRLPMHSPKRPREEHFESPDSPLSSYEERTGSLRRELENKEREQTKIRKLSQSRIAGIEEHIKVLEKRKIELIDKIDQTLNEVQDYDNEKSSLIRAISVQDERIAELLKQFQKLSAEPTVNEKVDVNDLAYQYEVHENYVELLDERQKMLEEYNIQIKKLENECIMSEKEIARLQGEIERRIPRILMLNNDKREVEARLQMQDVRLKNLRINETEIDSEMRILLSQKAKLMHEREVLMNKIAETKASAHVALKNLLGAQKRIETRLDWNIKTYACRILTTSVKRTRVRNMQEAIKKIEIYKIGKSSFRGGLAKLSGIVDCIKRRYTQETLLQLHAIFLNYPKLSYLNQELLRVKFEKGLMFRLWVQWRQKAKLLNMKREHQNNAVSRMIKILHEHQKREKNEVLSTLQTNSIRYETRIMELHSLFTKKHVKQIQRAFFKWVTFVHLTYQAKDRQQCEESLTNARFLGYFFTQLKNHAQKMKKSKFNLIKKNFEQWQNAYKEKRLFATYEVQADELNQLKNKKLLGKTFLGWKTTTGEMKKTRTWATLKEKTDEYQANLGTLHAHKDYSQNSIKSNCLRRMSIAMKQRIHHYIHIWGLNARKRTQKMILALKVMERAWSKSKRQNFKRWKVLSNVVACENRKQEQEQADYHISDLMNELERIDEWEQEHSVSKTQKSLLLLERIAKRYNRMLIYQYFRRFHDNSSHLNRNESAYYKGCAILHRLFLKVHRKSFISTTKDYLRQKKLVVNHQKFEENRIKSYQTRAFTAFKQNTERMKAVKRTLRKYLSVKWHKLVSKRFYYWAYRAHHIKNKEYERTNQELEILCETRTNDLERQVRANQGIQTVAEDYEEKAVNAKCKQVWILALQKVGQLKHNALWKWRDHAKCLFYKRKAAFLMSRCITRCFIRNFFARVIASGDKLELMKAKESLDLVLAQRKELKLKMDEEKEKFDTEHQQQEDRIKELTQTREELKRSKKVIVHKIEEKLNRESLRRLTLNVIHAWRHITCSHKEGVLKLARLMWRKVAGEAFGGLQRNREENANRERLRKLVLKWINSTYIERKKTAFDIWKRFKFLKRKESVQLKVDLANQTLGKISLYFDRVKESGIKQVELRYQTKTLRKYFLKLAEGTQAVKDLKRRKQKLVQRVNEEAKQNFFVHLREAIRKKKNRATIVENACRRRNLLVSKSLFNFWKEEVRKMKMFNRVLMRYQTIYDKRNMLWSLYKLSDYGLRKSMTLNHNKRLTAIKCFNFVKQRAVFQLKQTFIAFSNNTVEREILRKRVREMLIKALRMRLSPYFLKWKRKKITLDVISQSQKEGELYERKNSLEREINLLQDFAVKEGYKKEDLEFFHTKTERGISRLMLNSSGNTVLIKALNSWKEFVIKKKRIRQLSGKVFNYFRKPDLQSAFNVWKFHVADEKEEEHHISKKDLVKRIISRKNQDFFLTNYIERVETNQLELEVIVEKQRIELDVAKVLAVRSLGALELMFKRKYFRAMKAYDQEYKSSLKVDKSDGAREKIMKLQREIKLLENDYRGLFRENEILRTTSLQGLDITNAIQEITKERDRLSKELEAKEITVQKLVCENKNLSVRLATAQKEASELIRYTQEFLQPGNMRSAKQGYSKNETSGFLQKGKTQSTAFTKE